MTPDAHPALLEQAAHELRRAVTVPGPQPQWHRSMISRHRAEWPTLWTAIDHVLAALDERAGSIRPGPDDGAPEPAAPGGPFDMPDMPGEDELEQALLDAARAIREGYGDTGGAFEVEPDPAMRCGADVAGFRCTRALGHDGRHWSSSTSSGFGDVAGDGLNGE